MAADWLQWKQHQQHQHKAAQSKLEAVISKGLGVEPEDDHGGLAWPDHSYYAQLLDQSLEHKQRRIYVTKGSYFGQHRVESGDEAAAHHHIRSCLDSTLPLLSPAAPAAAAAAASLPAASSLSSSSSSPVSWRTAGSQQLAALVSQRSSGRVVANCDLPPPSPEAKPIAGSSPSSSVPRADDLLGEALCRSQTRAREAEKLAVRAFREKDELLHLFFREASMSLAYRQWLISLQAENLCLKMCHAAASLPSKSLLHFHHHCPQLQTSFPKRCNQHCHHHHHHHKRIKPDRGVAARPEDLLLRCTVAFALGLGLAGAGFMLGWGMGWIFFAF